MYSWVWHEAAYSGPAAAQVQVGCGLLPWTVVQHTAGTGTGCVTPGTITQPLELENCTGSGPWSTAWELTPPNGGELTITVEPPLNSCGAQCDSNIKTYFDGTLLNTHLTSTSTNSFSISARTGGKVNIVASSPVLQPVRNQPRISSIHFGCIEGMQSVATDVVCRGMWPVHVSPGSGFTQDASSGPARGEWHWATPPLSEQACEDKCAQLDTWGCNYVTTTPEGECFVHRTCVHFQEHFKLFSIVSRAIWAPGKTHLGFKLLTLDCRAIYSRKHEGCLSPNYTAGNTKRCAHCRTCV